MTSADGCQNGESSSEYLQNNSAFRLVFLGLVVMTPIIPGGMTAAYSSIALPQMKLKLDQISWFGSIISITCPFGCLLTGFIMDKYGRRISILASILPHIVGWFLLADKNAPLSQLYLGRLLTGFALGAASLPSIVYAAECITINNIRLRSSIGTWSTLFMAIGSFLVYTFGAILPHDKVALISGFLSVLSLFLILIFVPESPTWLHRKGRIGDAEMAQQRLGIKQPILQNRKLSLTTASLIYANKEADEYSLKNVLHYFSKIRRREVYKPLIITVTFLFFSQFSGMYCLAAYMVDVIRVLPLNLSPYFLSVISGALQICGCLLLTFLLPHSGVKMLSIASFLGVSAGFIVLALSVLIEDALTPNIFNYFHILSIWAITLIGSVGMVAIPYAILGEMFPMGAKGYASLSLFASSVFNFIVLKVFPYLFTHYRNIVFLVFSIICACGSVFVATCLPETVGKTMDEIKRGFQRLNSNQRL